MGEYLIVAGSIVLITLIIALTTSIYSSSESKRALVNSQEKYKNMEDLMRDKDKHYTQMLDDKNKECLRLTDVIKSLTEKNQNYNVNGKVDMKV
jgi:hypothetical protein